MSVPLTTPFIFYTFPNIILLNMIYFDLRSFLVGRLNFGKDWFKLHQAAIFLFWFSQLGLIIQKDGWYWTIRCISNFLLIEGYPTWSMWRSNFTTIWVPRTFDSLKIRFDINDKWHLECFIRSRNDPSSIWALFNTRRNWKMPYYMDVLYMDWIVLDRVPQGT